MIRRLPVVVGALVLASSLGVANADHIRISGGVHWRGGVSVNWSRSRPVWRPHRYHVSGSIYVGPTYRYYPRPYYVYYPVYVPSYYQTTSYYPVEPAPQGPSMVAPAPVQRPLARFGIGAFLGGSAVEAQDGGAHGSDDMGLLARFRLTQGLLIEGEIGKTSYDINGIDNARVDRRLGASLVYEIGARNRWSPYLLGGLGVQQADIGGGEFQTTQNYAELGAGLRWAISRNFHLAADARIGSRDSIDSNSDQMVYATGTTARVITPPTESSDENEEYTRFRLSAFIYF